MAKIIKKILVEFKEGFFDPKRVLSVAREDNKQHERFLYYSSKLWGKRETHKIPIKKKEFERLKGLAIRSEVIYTK